MPVCLGGSSRTASALGFLAENFLNCVLELKTKNKLWRPGHVSVFWRGITCQFLTGVECVDEVCQCDSVCRYLRGHVSVYSTVRAHTVVSHVGWCVPLLGIGVRRRERFRILLGIRAHVLVRQKLCSLTPTPGQAIGRAFPLASGDRFGGKGATFAMDHFGEWADSISVELLTPVKEVCQRLNAVAPHWAQSLLARDRMWSGVPASLVFYGENT